MSAPEWEIEATRLMDECDHKADSICAWCLYEGLVAAKAEGAREALEEAFLLACEGCRSGLPLEMQDALEIHRDEWGNPKACHAQGLRARAQALP